MNSIRVTNEGEDGGRGGEGSAERELVFVLWTKCIVPLRISRFLAIFYMRLEHYLIMLWGHSNSENLLLCLVLVPFILFSTGNGTVMLSPPSTSRNYSSPQLALLFFGSQYREYRFRIVFLSV